MGFVGPWVLSLELTAIRVLSVAVLYTSVSWVSLVLHTYHGRSDQHAFLNTDSAGRVGSTSNLQDRDERSRAFGLVNIPKLECCGGRCSCPENQCGCGENCGGCWIDDEYPAPAKDTQQISPPVSSARGPATNLATSSSVNLSWHWLVRLLFTLGLVYGLLHSSMYSYSY